MDVCICEWECVSCCWIDFYSTNVEYILWNTVPHSNVCMSMCCVTTTSFPICLPMLESFATFPLQTLTYIVRCGNVEGRERKQERLDSCNVNICFLHCTIAYGLLSSVCNLYMLYQIIRIDNWLLLLLVVVSVIRFENVVAIDR